MNIETYSTKQIPMRMAISILMNF